MNKKLPNLVYSDRKGKIYVHPDLKMLGMSAHNIVVPLLDQLIKLPKASTLLYMPGYLPFGWDDSLNQVVEINNDKNKVFYPVAAMLIPGFTRLLLPAVRRFNNRTILPQWAYTAVGWSGGDFVVAATKIDNLIRQRPYFYKNLTLLRKNISMILRQFPHNRLFRHLVNCALNYNCRAAQNLFFKRWEAPLPTSPVCNSRCLGCLSLQDSECSPASHSRIDFVPSPEEIAEVAINHLRIAKEAIVSFGQGCEGEPLLQFKTIKKAIILIRRATSLGTIHLNTNGYNSEYLKELASVGLDSVRISINSFRENIYTAYYRPKGYTFNDVLKSIRIAKKSRLFTSINLLIFPGISDALSEIQILMSFLKKDYIDLIQMRNLNIDIQFYLDNMPQTKEKAIGVLNMIKLIKSKAKNVKFGYFNLPKERFRLN